MFQFPIPLSLACIANAGYYRAHMALHAISTASWLAPPNLSQSYLRSCQTNYPLAPARKAPAVARMPSLDYLPTRRIDAQLPADYAVMQLQPLRKRNSR